MHWHLSAAGLARRCASAPVGSWTGMVTACCGGVQVRRAAAWLVDQGAEHIDLNFGCGLLPGIPQSISLHRPPCILLNLCEQQS